MGKPQTNIVVVDDDPELNMAIGRLLKASGYRASTFHSAEALLEENHTTNADCLVLDVYLPGLSGFELIRSLRRNGVTTPVIFISAYDNDDLYQQARDIGAVTCLIKPFQGKLLIEAIKKAVSL